MMELGQGDYSWNGSVMDSRAPVVSDAISSAALPIEP